MESKHSIIIGIIIVIGVCILATGCGFKSISASEFKDHFGALGYTVSETEKGLYESNSYRVATKDDVPFKIEYYEFANETDAKKVYKNYKDDLPNYITTNSKDTETKGAVITKYVAVSDNEYIVISRVKKTLIFIAGTNEYSKEIDKLLEDIGY